MFLERVFVLCYDKISDGIQNEKRTENNCCDVKCFFGSASLVFCCLSAKVRDRKGCLFVLDKNDKCQKHAENDLNDFENSDEHRSKRENNEKTIFLREN